MSGGGKRYLFKPQLALGITPPNPGAGQSLLFAQTQ
jgi:hypothetical protein